MGRSLLPLRAECSGCRSFDVAEHGVEVARRGEPQRSSDFTKGHIRLGQQGLGFSDLCKRDEPFGGNAFGGEDDPAHLLLTQIEIRRDVGGSDLLVEVVFDIAGDQVHPADTF